MLYLKWQHVGRRLNYQQIFKTTNWRMYIIPTNLAYFTLHFLMKYSTFKVNVTVEENTTRWDWLDWLLAMLQKKSCQFLWMISQSNQWCFNGFSGVKSLPCCYHAQKKSLIDGSLFTEWIKEVDRKFAAQNRKITLITNVWPTHPTIYFSTTKHDLKNTTN